MTIMGLDLSLTSTGYSINSDTSVITSKSKGAKRLFEISSTIVELCLEYGVTIVIIEGYSFASRNSQAHSIGELGGAVRMRLWENNIPFVDVPPTCRAKFATGRGNANKNEVVSSISAKTGIIWSGAGADDRCDAWILEQIGLAYLGKTDYTWPKESMSIMSKIDWSPMEGLIE